MQAAHTILQSQHCRGIARLTRRKLRSRQAKFGFPSTAVPAFWLEAQGGQTQLPQNPTCGVNPVFAAPDHQRTSDCFFDNDIR